MYLRNLFYSYGLFLLTAILFNPEQNASFRSFDHDKAYLYSTPLQDDSLSQGERFIYEYVGLQLYSFRNEMDKDVPGILSEVKQLGFRQVEVYNLHGLSALNFRLQLEKYNLHCTSYMVPYEMLQRDLKQVIKNAKTLGATYVVCPWIPHQVGTFSLIDMQKAVKDFNQIGEKLKAQGLQFCYHTHGYEFKPYEEGTLFDYMVAQTDSQYVNFEMDVYYVAMAGEDPVALMQKYPTRFHLMHLKDLKTTVPRGNLTGKAPVEWSVSLGTGSIDLQAILQQAQQIGIKHYYVEDESPAALQQIPLSLQHISGLKF